MTGRPLRILVAADRYYPPTTMGGPMAARRWAHALADRGHEVLVLGPSPSLATGMEVDGRTRIMRFPSLPLPHLRAEKRQQIRTFAIRPTHYVRKAIGLCRPDVIHVHFATGLGMAAVAEGRRQRIPVLGTNHSLPENAMYVYGRDFAERVRRRAPGLYDRIERRWWRHITEFYNRCDVMTAPTPSAIQLYLDQGLTTRSACISNGIDLGVYGRGELRDQAGAFRDRFGVPRDAFVILYAGRMHPEKRVDVLLDGFALVARQLGPSVHLVVAGGHDGPMEARILQMGLTDQVTVTGFLHPENELPTAYHAADVLASASECEGQGLVFLEGMATGLPVVAADKYAVRDTVLHERTGFLFPPGDAAALADTLVRLIREPGLRQTLGAQARAHAATHDISRSVDALEALMESLIRERSLQPMAA
jgi:glycosyltransferase involved in cell wall biosynthesis